MEPMHCGCLLRRLVSSDADQLLRQLVYFCFSGWYPPRGESEHDPRDSIEHQFDPDECADDPVCRRRKIAPDHDTEAERNKSAHDRPPPPRESLTEGDHDPEQPDGDEEHCHE